MTIIYVFFLVVILIGIMKMKKRSKKKEETIKEKRLSLLPIKWQKQWEFFKKQQGHFWTEDGIDYTQDVEDWGKMDKGLKEVFSKIFGIFNILDTVVNENIEDISEELPSKYLEAKCFYKAQEFMEVIHMKTYGDIIDTLIVDRDKEKFLLEMRNSKYILRKIELASRRKGKGVPLAEKIVANGCVEGIGFSSLFSPIFWLKLINSLPGVRFANEEIITDEAIHLEFAVLLYKDLIEDGFIQRLSQEKVYEIVQDFVNTEISCAKEILDVPPSSKKLLDVLTPDNMSQYIKFVADYYLTNLGYDKLYNVTNPFPFMNMTALITKSNFFEKRVAEYKQFQLNDTKGYVKTDLSTDF